MTAPPALTRLLAAGSSTWLAALPLLALLAVGTSGCHTAKDDPGIERVDFQGREDFAVAPNLRVRWVAQGEPTHGGTLRQVAEEGVGAAYEDLYSLEIEELETGFGGEAEFWATSGKFTQRLQAGERLDPHGSPNLDGPGAWETDIDLYLFSIGLNGGVSWRDLLVANGTIGLNIQGAIVEIDEVSNTIPQRDGKEELWRFGISLGGTVGVTPIVEWLLFYARFMGHWGIDAEHPTWLQTIDLGAELTVFPGVAVFCAYRWTNYFANRDEDDGHRDSDYDVRLEGPTFGLQLTF